MQRLIAALTVHAGGVLAHPGHGAPEGHVHTWGIEHWLLLAAMLAFLAYALKK